MKQLLLTTLLLSAMTTMAQRIDFNNSQNRTEDGYASWVVGQESGTITQTFDGVTLTIRRADGSIGTHLLGEWWKDGVNKYSRLTSDGLTVSGKADDAKYNLREGAVGISITVSGLSSGEHSLLAYHNNPAGNQGPVIDVFVDGTKVLSGVQQTNRAQSPVTSGQSYIRFSATEGHDVVVTYQTVPDGTVDYTQGNNTTSLYINGLVFDRPNPMTTASDPTPTHLDEHADCDGGQVILSWTPAATATKHHVYMGTSPSEMVLLGTSTEPHYSHSGLSPLNTYYWRVDEEDANGTVYEGDTWSFRPRRLAFPGAEGYGRYAIGGRGGVVYHVTTLLDNGDDANPLEGSFRYGIKKIQGPRTIVFDVAGVISLKSRLTCADRFVTIAGQTAPGRGVMITTSPFGMQTDGITRFLRLRLGHKRLVNGVIPEKSSDYGTDNGLYDETTLSGLDGMGMAGNDNAIMDHCSISWTIDEGFSSRGAKNITLQHTLISEALNQAGHPNYDAGTQHGYAATIGGGENGGLGASFHHNLLAHCEGRNWSMSGGLDGAGNYDGHHDMFNNVVYNWGKRACDGGTHEGQFVNNYYKMGPASTKTIIMEATLEGPHPGTQSYYVNGNIRENLNGGKTADKENDTYQKVVKAEHTQQWDVFVAEPFFPSYATIETAEAAYKNVLSDVGCTQPFFDLHDQRMVSETINRTTATRGSRSNKSGLIDSEEDAGCEGFNLERLGLVEAQRDANWDTDRDGIPDWFESVVGTNPQAANNNSDRDGDFYTDLEEYLNWMALPHFFLKKGQPLTIDLQPYFAGYKAPTFTLDPVMNNGSSWELSGDGRQLQIYCNNQQLNSVHVTATEDGISLTRQFNFVANDDLAGIEAMFNDQCSMFNGRSSKVYDLQGRRINHPHKGLNIQQGKKFVSK